MCLMMGFLCQCYRPRQSALSLMHTGMPQTHHPTEDMFTSKCFRQHSSVPSKHHSRGSLCQKVVEIDAKGHILCELKHNRNSSAYSLLYVKPPRQAKFQGIKNRFSVSFWVPALLPIKPDVSSNKVNGHLLKAVFFLQIHICVYLSS